jgi:crossover junction endodeoxyribonuclease RusA
MDNVLRLRINGDPAPKGSKRHVGGGRLIESSKRLPKWQQQIRSCVEWAWTGQPLAGPMGVRLDFVMPRPVSTPKRVTPAAVKRPDVDKLARAVLDELTGRVFVDDSQVVTLWATKRLANIGEQPGVWVEVMPDVEDIE